MMTQSTRLNQNSSGLRGTFKCLGMALSKPRPQSNWESVVWLKDCCTPAEPIQLDGAGAVLPWRRQKSKWLDMPSL
jgi:hypothetical protein